MFSVFENMLSGVNQLKSTYHSLALNPREHQLIVALEALTAMENWIVEKLCCFFSFFLNLRKKFVFDWNIFNVKLNSHYLLIDVSGIGWRAMRWHWIWSICAARLTINATICPRSCAVWEFQEGNKLLSFFNQSSFVTLCINLITNVFLWIKNWNFHHFLRLWFLLAKKEEKKNRIFSCNSIQKCSVWHQICVNNSPFPAPSD